MTIKIEFPADRKDIALAVGKALTEIGQGAVTAAAAVDSFSKVAEPEGPFHWLHHDSESHGISETWGQLQSLIDSDPLVEHVTEDAYNKVVASWAASTPTVDEQAVADMGNASSADQSVTHEQKAEAALAASDGAQVDEKGVPFNPELCGKAAIPFYGSGKKKGQWKKRQGVDEDAYDEWYAEALLGARIEEEPEEQATETTSDSNVAANAFGGQQQQAAADENVPQDAGQLMKWVSEQQAAGNITQQQVTDAYTALQLPFDAVMNPAYPVADNCAAIYNHLKGQI